MNEIQDKSPYSIESYRFLSGFLDLIISTIPKKAVGPRRRESRGFARQRKDWIPVFKEWHKWGWGTYCEGVKPDDFVKSCQKMVWKKIRMQRCTKSGE
jgi:hypothetical protein